MEKYKISRELLGLYYNIVGVDKSDVNLDYVPNEVRRLEKLSPYSQTEEVYTLPNSSESIDEQMQILLDRMCSFGYSEQGQLLKKMFHESFYQILRTVTNLNLIPKDSHDYELHFRRLNMVILLSLTELNQMEPLDVITFANLIKSKSIKDILKFGKSSHNLTLFTLLGMNPNSDLADYTIFEDNSDKIDYNKLIELVQKNIAHTDYDPDYKPFDLSMVGFEEFSFFGIKGIRRVDKNDSLLPSFDYFSKDYLDSLLRHYNMPFERLSHKRAKALTRKD